MSGTTHTAYYYKGTAFPIVSSMRREVAFGFAKMMLEDYDKQGLSRADQIKECRGRLDTIEEMLYKCCPEDGANFKSMEAVYRMAELKLGMNKTAVETAWIFNVCALLLLGEIKEDRHNGTQELDLKNNKGGVSVVDASNMTKDDIDLLNREMKASGYGECIEIGRKNTAECVLKCGRKCEKKNDAVGLAHRNTPTLTFPQGSWVCDECWTDKGMCCAGMIFHEEDGVKCLGCSYTFGENGFAKEASRTIPANLIEVIKPKKKNPDHWCFSCLESLKVMSLIKEQNPDDEFQFVGRTEGADDGFEPIEELRAKLADAKVATGDADLMAIATEEDVSRMRGMMEYNDLFLNKAEILKVLSGHRFVIDKDSRIRLRKKEQEAEKVAAEVVANAEMFVEEKKEKPKTKKQIQADATKASNQAVKDKKKAQIEYEKAIIECAKLRAEVERLAKEKKYRAKMAKQKTAKAEEGK